MFGAAINHCPWAIYVVNARALMAAQQKYMLVDDIARNEMGFSRGWMHVCVIIYHEFRISLKSAMP